MLSTLGFQRFVAPEPPPQHVELEVMAAGLNFKEVLTALGLIDRGRPFGLECAGRVTRVGVGVQRWKAGDDVIAFGTQWTMPLACVPEKWVQSKPAALGFEEAATVPVAFTVAYHGLVHEARLRRGETVLIHSGCGGVGLAAIQIARRIGARIMATAGTEAKRAFLRNIGVECVSDSRTPDFACDALAWTDGRGVDVLLNSLGGDLIDHGLDALAPRGRFVELGRRDLAENRPIGLQRLAKGLQFLPVLPDPNDPAFVAAWHEVIQLFLDRELTPLPYRSFCAARIAEAFEEMSKGKHIGKLVLVPGGVYPSVSRDIHAGVRGEMNSVVHTLVQGMTPTEGAEAFRRALTIGLPEILVSTQDLNAMLRQQAVVSEHGHEAFWSARKYRVERAADPRGAETTVRERPDADLEADVDARLRDIWQDLLGVADIGPDDDFFDLGGDSLIAVRMIARLKEVLDVEQTLQGLFEASTFRQMSELMRTAGARPLAV
jgi:NADPH:quinone reductase-like Zn-dependent oxidoreductase/acyl carrier protein